MDLKESFDKAVKESKELTSRPDNETLLKLYSLYKQATEGDMDPNTPAPGMFDFVAKAKYDAWQKLRGTSAESAMTDYIATVQKLQAGK
ncbi:acyl-CoA-binding protein [Mucilaginibacter sp. RS28]|uniref:Acyl-CoA-binding protein n=1 Tax=Mucilaginibacter straminoryzae TaxID=2932774 RepID=A0A9X1X325_9SPHI|nr:acyl-CoA-binding protein [Mucilaginibacter straminoryzae]MCJ8209110.1 acyl-CoA-binding protein [Mucilaginibacter straminoryzae]